MKAISLSLLFLSILFSSLSYSDMRQEQKMKQLQQELIRMSPLVQTCVLMVKNNMSNKEVNHLRIIQDFDDLVEELCRMQDNLHQEKK